MFEHARSCYRGFRLSMEPSFYETYFQMERDHWWFVARRNIILDAFEQRRLLPAEARILDVGCGSGSFVNIWQDRGYEAHGCDPYPRAVEFGRQNGVHNLTVSDGKTLPYETASFDVVQAFDVLEHIQDDAGAIGEMWRVLKPGGIVIATVPAFSWLWSVHDIAAHHHRRYAADGLRALISTDDRFKIEKLTYFNFFLFVPVLLVRRAGHLLGRHFESELGMPRPFMNALLRTVFQSEILLLRRRALPFGVSLMVIARKAT